MAAFMRWRQAITAFDKGIELLLRIVSCRWAESIDPVRRQLLLERNEVQFLKAMVQSRHLGMEEGFCPGGGKPLDPYSDP